jgi:hypothetical protein
MASYSVSEKLRAELKRIATSVTDCIVVRHVMEAYDDAGSSCSRNKVFVPSKHGG